MNDTLMVDGVGTDVPAILARFGRIHPVQGYLAQPGVLPYIPWTRAQYAEFPQGHIVTATRGGRPSDARHARELDVETGDATFEDVAAWIAAREDYGHEDGQIYCDLTNLADVLAAIHGSGLWDKDIWRIRLAWYWQRPGAPSRPQVMTQVKTFVPADLIPPAWRFWGCQYFAGGSYDMNIVYGPTDFTRP